MKKQIYTALLSLIFILTAGGAQAALTTQHFSGQILFAANENPFGVAENDSFSWTTTYDLKDLDMGDIVIGNSGDYKLRVSIGAREFIETEDVFYGPGPFGAPILSFNDNHQVAGISMTIDDMAKGYRFKAFEDSFNIFALNGTLDGDRLVSGRLSFEAAPVPVPGAAWLLGSGLVGLIGLRSRRA